MRTGWRGLGSLALDRSNYRAVLNAVMTLPSPTQCGKFRDKHKGFRCSGILRCDAGVVIYAFSKERFTFILKGQVDQEGNYYRVKWDDREWQITYPLEQSPS